MHTRLLQNARRTLLPGGRLFVIEMILPEDDPAGALCDLHLLAVTGGRERTRSEYAALLDLAGFAIDSVRPLPTVPSVIFGEARRGSGSDGSDHGASDWPVLHNKSSPAASGDDAASGLSTV